MSPQPWTVRAVNLADHADNPIHTDAGAQAAGFPRALVAGVSTYAVLTRPVVADDSSWIASGAGELRLAAPVFDGDVIEMVPSGRIDDASCTIEAMVDGSVRATLTILDPPTVTAQIAAMHEAEPALRPMTVTLSGTYSDYGTRAGDDLEVYANGLVHPSVWLNLANRMFAEQLVSSSWVHTRSRFVHHSTARVGEVVTVTGAVVRRFSTGSGARAVAVVRLATDGRALVDIEHEAIVSMRANERHSAGMQLTFGSRPPS